MTRAGYAAVVYDLDNTLVTLDVDWDAVARDAARELRERGVEPPEDLWRILEVDDPETRAAVETVIAAHEREGARASTRLPAADLLPHEVPVAVCSLNCEAACRAALDRHGLDAHVACVVGRDSVSTHKPDPGPLRAAVDALGASPGESVFVGDSPRDEATADAAGVPFRYVSEWLRA